MAGNRNGGRNRRSRHSPRPQGVDGVDSEHALAMRGPRGLPRTLFSCPAYPAVLTTSTEQCARAATAVETLPMTR